MSSVIGYGPMQMQSDRPDRIKQAFDLVCILQGHETMTSRETATYEACLLSISQYVQGEQSFRDDPTPLPEPVAPSPLPAAEPPGPQDYLRAMVQISSFPPNYHGPG